MKRGSRVRVALAMLSLLSALTAPAQFSYVASNGTVTITGYSGPGVVITPKYINTLPVTAIGDYAFSYSGISAIRISEGIRTIGLQAFSSCDNLTDVILPNSLTNIGVGAFAYCPALPAIGIPHGAIGAGAFAECPSLTNVNIGPGVDYVSGDAFPAAPIWRISLWTSRIRSTSPWTGFWAT